MWQLKYCCQSTAAAMANKQNKQQQWKQTQVGLGAFLAVLDGGKSSLAEKRFFVKKNGYMGVHGCAPICPFFYEKNVCSTRLAFCMLRAAKKAAKGTRACLRSSSSGLATVIQLSTPRRGRFWRCLVSLCPGAVRCTQPTDPPQIVFYAQGYCPGISDHRRSDSPYSAALTKH